MTVRTTYFNGSDWTREPLQPADLNDTVGAIASSLSNLNATANLLLLTGSELNSTYTASSGGVGSNIGTLEFPDISAADLRNTNYLIITITGASQIESTATEDVGTNATIFFSVQSKELTGTYSDSLAYYSILSFPNEGGNSTVAHKVSTGTSFTWIHTLTTDEKTNGVKIKILSKSYASSSASNTQKATFTHLQSYLRKAT